MAVATEDVRIPAAAIPLAGAPVDLRKRRRPGEIIIQGFLLACGTLSILTTLGIVYVLLMETLRFFGRGGFNPLDFVTKTTWQPAIGEFGIWPLVTATFVTSLVAMTVAVPLGLSVAIYLSEYASTRARSTLKPILEVLVGIPTVVYGFFALTFVTPGLRSLLGRDTVEIYNMAAAGLVMGIMILPTISSISEDALSAVPNALREGAYALGATKLETAVKVVVPAALSGIIAAFILGMSRAIGETMIVAIAAGSGPSFTVNPLHAAETMTGHIVRLSGGDLSYDSIEYSALFAIALMLFLITLVLNLLGRQIIKRFRESYE